MNEVVARRGQVHGLKYNGALGSRPAIQGLIPKDAIIFMVVQSKSQR